MLHSRVLILLTFVFRPLHKFLPLHRRYIRLCYLRYPLPHSYSFSFECNISDTYLTTFEYQSDVWSHFLSSRSILAQKVLCRPASEVLCRPGLIHPQLRLKTSVTRQQKICWEVWPQEWTRQGQAATAHLTCTLLQRSHYTCH